MHERMNAAHRRVLTLYQRYMADPVFAQSYDIEITVNGERPGSRNVAIMQAIAKKEIGDEWEFEVMEFNCGPSIAILHVK